MNRNDKLTRFHPNWEGIPEIIEFWELSNNFLDKPLQFVRVQGPFPEMFQWDWFNPSSSRSGLEETMLELLRDEELEKE